jgi:hypothetical protein
VWSAYRLTAHEHFCLYARQSELEAAPTSADDQSFNVVLLVFSLSLLLFLLSFSSVPVMDEGKRG